MDLLHCHSEALLVLLQLPHKPRCRKLGIVADTYDTQTRIEHQTRGGSNGELALELGEVQGARLAEDARPEAARL